MRTRLTKMLGIEFPIFAFTHCRDVAAAVSNAGGFGVLGAVGHTPEQLDIDLKWIAEKTNGRPVGVDLLIPRTYVGSEMGGIDGATLRSMIPPEHREWIEELLARYGVPPPQSKPAQPLTGERDTSGLRIDPKSMAPLIDVAFEHKVKLIASALGSPPDWLVERARKEGIPVAALAGRLDHALAHKEAGADIIIAQGTEGGGHTGEIGTMVLVPQVVDAVAPIPVLAAGGIGNGRQMAAAMALGAEGVWCGSVWLTTHESETTPVIREKFLAAKSADTLRSKSLTGKPARMLKTAWTAAWESPDAPTPLGMPLQSILVADAQRRIHRAAESGNEGVVPLVTYFVGQVVGQMNVAMSSRDVVRGMVEEYLDAMERMNGLVGGEG